MNDPVIYNIQWHKEHPKFKPLAENEIPGTTTQPDNRSPDYFKGYDDGYERAFSVISDMFDYGMTTLKDRFKEVGPEN